MLNLRLQLLVQVLGAVALVCGASAAPAQAEAISGGRAAELEHLLLQDCGSCHGMRLTGGLGPALTPALMATRSTAALSAIILHGVPGTAMPPWSALLSEEDARWLALRLRNGPPAQAEGHGETTP